MFIIISRYWTFLHIPLSASRCPAYLCGRYCKYYCKVIIIKGILTNYRLQQPYRAINKGLTREKNSRQHIMRKTGMR